MNPLLPRKKSCFSILFVCLIFLATKIHAQDYKFSHISVADGLSQAVVNCMIQDEKGFMWFGTQEGLNRYDGYNFKIFKRDPEETNSLSNNFIYALKQDKKGMIWIGTNGGGLNSFDPITERFSHFTNDPKNPNSISNDVVRIIHEDKNGKLWIGTDGGMNEFDPSNGKFIRYQNKSTDPNSISSDHIYDIIEDAAGNIWAGSYGKGISMFEAATKRFYNYELSGEDFDRLFPKSVPADPKRREQCLQVRSLLLFDATHIWVGTNGGGIESFNTQTRAFDAMMYPDGSIALIASTKILTMCDDQEGNIWVGTFDKGIDVINKSDRKIQHYTQNEHDNYAISSSGIKCIYRDGDGNMWMGTNGEGINIYFTSTSTITHIRHSERPEVGDNTLKSNAILSVMEDHTGLLWIGTSGGGLSTMNRENGQYLHFPQLSTASNNSILSLMESSSGIIWVGTYGEGLNSYDPETKTIKSYTPDNQIVEGTVLCIVEEPRTGFIWFGTFGAGVYCLNPKTDSIKQYTVENSGISSNYIYCLFFDGQRNLWIGTRGGGVTKFDMQTGKFQVFDHDDKVKKSLSNNIVYCITEDNNATLWIGTANGLDKFEPSSGTFEILYERDGLPSDNIYTIIPDDAGNLWMSHNKGLTRFNPNPGKNERFKNFGSGAGVQPAEFNQGAYFKNKKGELFFGGQAGLNIINPAKVERPAPAPPIYIVSYKRFGKEVGLDTNIIDLKHLNVTWRDNNFMFELVALNFIDPEKNLYQYKLEGVEEEWSPITSNRYVSYTNLSGGNYILHVRATDCNGHWSEDEAVLFIYVEPPFWRTNWFYAICVLVIISSIFIFIRIRTAAITKENRILEAKVAERTQELAQKNADITSSIQYAKRIQSAMLPELEVIYQHFPDSFVLYKPKDIVSGDFYWFEEKSGKKILCVGDCTGHGVPGALMSMIGHNILNQVILEKGILAPDQILNGLNEGVRAALKQDQHDQDTTDGMDIGIISYDVSKKEILFAGALRPLIVIRKGLLSKLDSDRFPIGGSHDTRAMKFSVHRFFVDSGDTIYMFSDGFADQFGGERGKKFMVKNLLAKLQSMQDLDMKNQAALLDETFETWKHGFQQVDDVLVVGVRIP